MVKLTHGETLGGNWKSSMKISHRHSAHGRAMEQNLLKRLEILL